MSEIDNILGYDTIKEELKHYLNVMKYPEDYAGVGIVPARGFLFYGDVGVGKTYIAKAFIKDSGRMCYFCSKTKSGEEFLNDLRTVFDKARRFTPSVVFLDDLDKFAELCENEKANEFVVVQSLIDGLGDADVVVVATATDVKQLPLSLLAVRRFDKVFNVEVMLGKKSKLLVEGLLKQVKLADDVNVDEISKIFMGQPCGVVKSVINSAGVYAVYDGRNAISTDDLIKAYLRNLSGFAEEDEFNEEHALDVAVHEAGHAVVSELLNPEKVTMISIVNDDGSTSYYVDNSYFGSVQEIENRVKILLGGRASTELVNGVVDVGTNNDLKRAFDLASNIVDTCCGSGFDKSLTKSSSDKLKEKREQEISALLDKLYQETKALLEENRGFLDALIKEVVEHKIVLASQIQEIKNATLKTNNAAGCDDDWMLPFD